MKKLLLSVLAIGLLTGCGSQSTTDQKSEKSTKSEAKTTETAKKTADTTPKSKYPFPNSAPIGSGKLSISTPSGNSDNGNVPVLFLKQDEMMVQITADLQDFQGDKQTFIYIDKFFNETEQVGEHTETSLNLQENTLKPGVHTVTAVQFENDDPASGKVINFVEAKYEVKAAK